MALKHFRFDRVQLWERECVLIPGPPLRSVPDLAAHLRAKASGDPGNPGASQTFTASIRCSHCKGTGRNPPSQARIEVECAVCEGPGGWAREGTASELLEEIRKLTGGV
jgi:hypothetical protein